MRGLSPYPLQAAGTGMRLMTATGEWYLEEGCVSLDPNIFREKKMPS
jgi:hypothetical protein